jgi:alkanesulfonate monooxygenase SsuD/methylene tetrahydromethanopterin reductase-like flavin-dependent oxidoreductase (luciferase family)
MRLLMKIGMNLPVMVPGLDRDAILEWSRRIDAGPFSHIAAGERIAFPNPEIMVTLSAAAAVSSRARILTNVVVLPMHSAVLKAKQLATLDVVSGGRLSVGVGVGAREEDFAAVGAPFEKRRLARIADQVALMRRVWAGENVVEGALRPVEPLPVQPGGPEILSGSLSPESVRRAARWADGICGFSFGPSIAEVGACFETARTAWEGEGRETPPRLVTGCWFALGTAAREQMDRYLQRYLRFLGPGVAEQLAPTVTTTSAQALADAVRRLADCGADELSLVPTTADPDEIDRVVEALF